MQTQKCNIEIDLNPSQIQVIVNAWRTVDFETFFMISVTLWPFIPAGAQDEMNFLVSVGYQKKHLALKHAIGSGNLCKD